MSDSKTVMSNPPTYQRRNRRLWLTPEGQPVTAAQEVVPEPEPKQAVVEWSAHIVDLGTGEEVKDYPHLEGEATVRIENPVQSKADIASVYVAKLGLLDTTTVSKEAQTALKDKLNAGIWEVVAFCKEQTAEVAA